MEYLHSNLYFPLWPHFVAIFIYILGSIEKADKQCSTVLKQNTDLYIRGLYVYWRNSWYDRWGGADVSGNGLQPG